MPATYNILLMGASYGSLLASKLLFGGHSIHLVCLPAEADLINAEGFKVRLPIRGRKDPVLLESRKLPGKVTAGPAAGVDPKNYDLVGLCMQEPQYRSPGVRELLDAVAKSRVPCMSIMNMPPLPYIKRIPGLDYEALKPAYTDPSVWDSFDPQDHHAEQPGSAGDPSAGREGQCAAGHAADQFQMRTVRRRQEHGDSAPARRRCRRGAVRHAGRQDRTAGQAQGLRIRSSCRSPNGRCCCAGNYRCVTKDGMRTAQEAVHSDIETSRSVYNFVFDLCVKLGAKPDDLVPFEKYAAAAQSLTRPASAARALQNGAPNIERADKLVQLIAKQKGLSHPAIDAQVALVDARLEANRKKQAA